MFKISFYRAKTTKIVIFRNQAKLQHPEMTKWKKNYSKCQLIKKKLKFCADKHVAWISVLMLGIGVCRRSLQGRISTGIKLAANNTPSSANNWRRGWWMMHAHAASDPHDPPAGCWESGDWTWRLTGEARWEPSDARARWESKQLTKRLQLQTNCYRQPVCTDKASYPCQARQIHRFCGVLWSQNNNSVD